MTINERNFSGFQGEGHSGMEVSVGCLGEFEVLVV